MATILHPLFALLLAPMILGIITKVKAIFAGRQGPPIVQPYYDIIKFIQKGSVFSNTTTWLFGLGPSLGLAVMPICLMFLPLGNLDPAISFQGDFVFVIYLLALARFFTVLAAMDTGSAFEGMGSSREMGFSALAEPALLFALATLARKTGSLSMSGLISGISPDLWQNNSATLVLVLIGLFLVFLAENSRIPVDDPTTHLELTMIHEVMVLDHSGVDFGIIEYAASLKMWILGIIIAAIAVPIRTGYFIIDTSAMLAALVLLAILVGIIESTMSRLRLLQIPHLLVGACLLSVVGFLIH
ncbi:MAG: NADH-quinone oxidoreductase subunit H [Candidatus Riflebacteria bacterium]|nr:NADH-quinone oxidoreductase subunit H [Candidatus Riflebacteria bacterium]